MWKMVAVKGLLALSVASAGAYGAVSALGPDSSDEPVAEQPAADESGAPENLPLEAQEGRAAAEAKHQAALAYAEQVRVWTECVAAAATAQGEDDGRQTETFDPRSGCGERPEPGAELTAPPPQAADADPTETEIEDETDSDEGAGDNAGSQGSTGGAPSEVPGGPGR